MKFVQSKSEAENAVKIKDNRTTTGYNRVDFEIQNHGRTRSPRLDMLTEVFNPICSPEKSSSFQISNFNLSYITSKRKLSM